MANPSAPTPTHYQLAVDARAFSGHPNGYTVYLTSIIRPLLARGWQITLLTNQPLDQIHELVKSCRVAQFGPRSASRWEQRALPAYLSTHQPDLYFAGTNRGIPWQRPTSTRLILGLLDVIPYKFPRYYLFAGKLHFLRHELIAQLMAIWRADAIVTISQNSATDIRRYFHRKNVTPLLISLPAVTPPSQVKPKDQFVYVGGIDPRKRVDNLLRALALFSHEHPDFKLALIGGGYQALQPLIDRLGLGEQVVMTGYLSEAVKQHTIAESRALVYPSLYEGYGLAIAEGLQAGIPVVAGAGGAQHEIGGEAVIYINPNDPVDIARGLTRALDQSVQSHLETARPQQLATLTDPRLDQRIGEYFEQQAEMARERLRHG